MMPDPKWKERSIEVEPGPVSKEFIDAAESAGARPDLIEALRLEREKALGLDPASMERHIASAKKSAEAYGGWDRLVAAAVKRVRRFWRRS
jgi:hypothetical protein